MDAVVLGASSNSLSVARSLGRAGLRVTVVETAEYGPVRNSRYVARYVVLDDIDDAGIARQILAVAGGDERPFLMATSDRFALLVARFRELLQESYRFVSPSFPIIDAIVDKSKLYETARRNGLPHPRFHAVADRSDIELAVAAIATPCYVKPALSHRWRQLRRGKLERAETEKDLRRSSIDGTHGTDASSSSRSTRGRAPARS